MPTLRASREALGAIDSVCLAVGFLQADLGAQEGAMDRIFPTATPMITTTFRLSYANSVSLCSACLTHFHQYCWILCRILYSTIYMIRSLQNDPESNFSGD